MVNIGSGNWKWPEGFVSMRLGGAVRVFDEDPHPRIWVPPKALAPSAHRPQPVPR